MRTNADTPDPVAAAAAIVAEYAKSALATPPKKRGIPGPIIAVAAGVTLALIAVVIMLVCTTAMPA